ncbi:hypothetical protein ACQJBY_030773 [Aegilops geniculata]
MNGGAMYYCWNHLRTLLEPLLYFAKNREHVVITVMIFATILFFAGTIFDFAGSSNRVCYNQPKQSWNRYGEAAPMHGGVDGGSVHRSARRRSEVDRGGGEVRDGRAHREAEEESGSIPCGARWTKRELQIEWL